MTSKKLLWIVIPLSFVLGGVLTFWFVTPKVVETINVFQGDAKIQNIKYRTAKLVEIQKFLENDEYEKAGEIIDIMYEVDILHLELMQEGEPYPKQIRFRAKKVLAEIESAPECLPKNERRIENSN